MLTVAMVPNGKRTFYSSACLVCLKASANIRRCSKCKIVAYCSEEHQRQDWKSSHKALCQVISNCKLAFTGSTFEEFQEHQRTLRKMWKCDLKRDLHIYELMMTFFPRVCAVCFSTNNVFTCEKCLNVFYCSKRHEEDHRVTHKDHCDKLRLRLTYDQYMCSRSNVILEFTPVDNRELYSCKDIRKHISSFAISKSPNYLSMKECTEGLQMANDTAATIALNILHSLKITNTIKSDIAIHIIIPYWFKDSDMYDILLLTTNIVRHWIPEITGFVKYYIADPEASNKNAVIIKDNITIKYFTGAYQDVMGIMEKPDIIFVFDPQVDGFTPYNFLPPPAALLYSANVPLIILTCAYPNAIRAKEVFSNFEHTVVVDISENPFVSIVPERNWMSQFEPIVYFWKYIFIVKRTPESIVVGQH